MRRCKISLLEERSRDGESKKRQQGQWVITDTFFAVDDDRIVGIIDFRHTLNDFLKNLGHCGYSVRPSERRKGFATEMLRQLLEVAQKTGLNELYLSVERKNEPSVKTITRNGGVYERWIFTGSLCRNNHTGTRDTAELQAAWGKE